MDQLEKDIAFCIDECDMDDEQIGEMLRACETLGGIGVEYFCEEFIFVNEDGEAEMQWHEDEYLSIADFNSLYWEGN
mgnify:FL=1